MDVATLLIAHHVLAQGGIRNAARFLRIPASNAFGAMKRLQSQIATPLMTVVDGGIQPTLEGNRLKLELARAADLVRELARLRKGERGREYPGSRLTISILMLRRFIAVVHAGSIRSAAQALKTGQPQLTRQLRTLEREVGLPLLVRSGRGVTLTKQGHRVLELAQALDTIWSSLSQNAATRFHRSQIIAKLGSVSPLSHESTIARILAVLSAKWQEKAPQSPLLISGASSEELLAGIQNHTYDVILLDTDDVPKALASRVVSRSPLMLVGPSPVLKHAGTDIRRAILSGPLALPSLKSGLRQKLVALMKHVLSDAEREMVPFVEVDSIPVLGSLVQEHGFISLFPENALQAFNMQFESIPLPRTYDVRLTLAWRRVPASEKIALKVLAILQDYGLVAVKSRLDRSNA